VTAGHKGLLRNLYFLKRKYKLNNKAKKRKKRKAILFFVSTDLSLSNDAEDRSNKSLNRSTLERTGEAVKH